MRMFAERTQPSTLCTSISHPLPIRASALSLWASSSPSDSLSCSLSSPSPALRPLLLPLPALPCRSPHLTALYQRSPQPRAGLHQNCRSAPRALVPTTVTGHHSWHPAAATRDPAHAARPVRSAETVTEQQLSLLI
eukprot:750609-Hanusia_phi.AAC.8